MDVLRSPQRGKGSISTNYRGIIHRPWGRWAIEIRDPRKGVRDAQTRAVKANPHKALPTDNHTLQRLVFNQDFSLMTYTSDDSLGLWKRTPTPGADFIGHFASMKDQSGFQSFTPADGDMLCFTSKGATLSVVPNLDGKTGT
ncbi:hypothetical protein IFM89_002063 [Coptis chinensis]|uniref:AP2/ERF domain-containing protein n=1 Tax=Coptis chinensis TaxID=261450 RepID=A0A835HY56_9MAGN|nr:hypothetical protein IFM89_002063 [Coptis chinensis]